MAGFTSTPEIGNCMLASFLKDPFFQVVEEIGNYGASVKNFLCEM